MSLLQFIIAPFFLLPALPSSPLPYNLSHYSPSLPSLPSCPTHITHPSLATLPSHPSLTTLPSHHSLTTLRHNQSANIYISVLPVGTPETDGFQVIAFDLCAGARQTSSGSAAPD